MKYLCSLDTYLLYSLCTPIDLLPLSFVISIYLYSQPIYIYIQREL